MKIKTKIRQSVSQAFDTLIPENQWQRYIDLIDKNGFSRKQTLTVMMLLCQQVEKLENLIEDLYFQVEYLEGSHPKEQVRTATQDFKLRTPQDVADDMNKQWHPNTKAFYVSPSDFKVLEKNVDPVLAKTDATKGYNREVDPKDGKEKTCLLHRDLPVFRNKE